MSNEFESAIVGSTRFSGCPIVTGVIDDDDVLREPRNPAYGHSNPFFFAKRGNHDGDVGVWRSG